MFSLPLNRPHKYDTALGWDFPFRSAYGYDQFVKSDFIFIIIRNKGLASSWAI